MTSSSTIFAANQVLTLAIANTLVGKKIACVSSEYHMNNPTVYEFTIASLVNEFQHLQNTPCDRGFANKADYFASWMTREHIEERKNTILLIDTNGKRVLS